MTDGDPAALWRILETAPEKQFETHHIATLAGLVTYLPVRHATRKPARGRHTTVCLPFIGRYMFLGPSKLADAVHQLMDMRLAKNPSPDNSPVSVPAHRLAAFLAQHRKAMQPEALDDFVRRARRDRVPALAIGENIAIDGGPFDGYHGSVVDVMGHRALIALTIGRDTRNVNLPVDRCKNAC